MWEPVPMRRSDRVMPQEEALALLQSAEWGVLATATGEGLPLATPLSYVLLGGVLYFHCARTGQKLTNIAQNSRVCFCVVGATRPKMEPPLNFTTEFASVVAHGSASLVTSGAEREEALMALCQKYLPQHMDKFPAAFTKSEAATAIVRIDIDTITGKHKA